MRRAGHTTHFTQPAATFIRCEQDGIQLGEVDPTQVGEVDLNCRNPGSQDLIELDVVDEVRHRDLDQDCAELFALDNQVGTHVGHQCFKGYICKRPDSWGC